jgi:hypothetical protein
LALASNLSGLGLECGVLEPIPASHMRFEIDPLKKTGIFGTLFRQIICHHNIDLKLNIYRDKLTLMGGKFSSQHRISGWHET